MTLRSSLLSTLLSSLLSTLRSSLLSTLLSSLLSTLRSSLLSTRKEETSLLHSRILMLNRSLERFFPLIFPQPASLWGKGIERSVTKVGQERTDLGLRMVKGRVVCGRRPAGGKLSFPPILFSFHYHLLCPRSNPAALGPCYLWLEA
jgi:hypothetical protein